MVNRIKNGKHDIKFISYTGGYPILCMGVLTLNIDGEDITFGNSHKDVQYPRFWESGGYVGFDKEWNPEVSNEEWVINEEYLPDFLKDDINVIDKIFNENVPYGCCGGCI